MYIFNRITVNPQLPKRIEKLGEISNNLWWSWNTEFLRLFKKIDIDLWDLVEKNPVKFLKRVSQEKLEEAAKDSGFLKEYDKIAENFENYINSKNTWFSKTYPRLPAGDRPGLPRCGDTAPGDRRDGACCRRNNKIDKRLGSPAAPPPSPG